MHMDIHIRDVASIYPAGTIRTGDTALVIAADQQGVHLDPDASRLGDDVGTVLDILLRLTARPVYVWADQYDSAHQQIVVAMQARGAINIGNDGSPKSRYYNWQICRRKNKEE